MEIITNDNQLVNSKNNVIFTDTVVPSNNCAVSHRNDSGLVTLRGITSCQCRARFKVSFGGNIAIPSTGTAGPISLAIAIDGEAVRSTTMTVTPTAVSEFFNVFSSIFIDVPKGCCLTVSVQNISDVAIDVQNANMIIERVA